MKFNFLIKYRFELLIIFLQLIGPISIIGLILGCVYIFYLIGFKRKLDLVSVFILLIPSIAIGYIAESADLISDNEMANSWLKLYLPAIKTVYIIGPVAVSIPFLAALAIPFRLIRSFEVNPNKLLLVLWFVVLLISLIELFWAIGNNQVSDAGLTVGFRTALTIGAALIPLSIERNQLEKQIMIIVKISVVLFLLGLLNGLWKFVAFAFSAYLIFSDENIFWKSLGVISLIIILSFKFSFTLVFTALGALFLVMFYSKRKSGNIFLKSKTMRFLLFLFPILFMLFLVSSDMLMESKFTNIFSERFQLKLFEDRVPIWTFTLDFVLKSNFFIVPAARDIPVIDYGGAGNSEWGIGAHNIYLEMARQLGVFATLLITLIIGYITLKSLELVKINSNLSKFLLSLFAVYLVWGLTGNALVWDGTGFLYWLIIGQIYQNGLSIKRSQSKSKEKFYLQRAI